MSKLNARLYEWMEDFDRQDMSEDARRFYLQTSVDVYNRNNNTSYPAVLAYYNYLSWLKDKQKP